MPNCGSSTVKAVVVCIGNELIADDSIGHDIYERLLELHTFPNMRLEYCGVGGIALLDLLCGKEELMVVVDAVQLGGNPGTIHVLPWTELPSQSHSAISAHGIGLPEAIAVGYSLFPELMPDDVVLVGIEGKCFNETRDAMTPQVRDSVEPSVILISDILNNAVPGHNYARS